MSRKLFAFLISELKIARIVCQKCGAAIEVPIDKLGDGTLTDRCKACPATFGGNRDANENPFYMLAQAASLFRSCKNAVDIEFILPDNSDAK